MNQLPIDTTEIFTEWHGPNCGLRVTTYMEDGQAHIGLYPLNWAKAPGGAPIYFRRQRLTADIMIGRVKGKPFTDGLIGAVRLLVIALLQAITIGPPCPG